MGHPRSSRRKAVVISSDEEDEDNIVVEDILSEADEDIKKTEAVMEKPNARRTRSATKNPSKEIASAPQSRSSKVKSKTATASEPNRGNKSIYSFFNAATQRQKSQPSQPPQSSASPEKPRASQDRLEEDILDDISGDDVSVPFSKGSNTALALRKRKLQSDQFGAGGDNSLPSASQKFRKVSEGTKLPAKPVEDRRPWTEQFVPLDLSELAVHKRKVQDVRNVLEFALSSRAAPRLIVLKGPAGAAKTTTVNLLAEDIGADVVEWRNPAGTDGSSGAYVSASSQFEDFVLRSGQYAGLQLATSDGTISMNPPTVNKQARPQIMVVEEFPNTFARTSTVLQSFRSTIQQFLAISRSSLSRPTPLIIIVSEALLSTSTASADSFTAHRLLGPQILSHPQTVEIEFNPVAITYMVKALDTIMVKEARRSGRRKMPGPQVLKHIGETGDIRSAVSSLEFICSIGDEGDMWSAKVAFTKPKGGKREAPLTKQEQDALKLISNRETSLGIFHAVGRVVYNKRLDPEQPVPQPPNHLPQHRRPRIPENNIDDLINELGTDTGTFIAAVHENYPLSCNLSSTEDALDSLNGCIDALSDSDLLSFDRFGFGTRAFSGSTQDNLRQDDMSFQTAVRGVLFALPSPVHRVEGGSGWKGDAFRMFYPASLKSWKRKEETEETLDLVVQALQNGAGLNSNSRPSVGRTEGVEGWKRSSNLDTAPVASGDEDEQSPLLSALSSSAKTEMLLDRLPYTSRILSQRRNVPSSLLSDISTLTSLQGDHEAHGDLNDPENADEDIMDHAGLSEWTTDRPDVEPGQHKGLRGKGAAKRLKRAEVEGGGLHIPVEHAVERLVLSDDDIEDD